MKRKTKELFINSIEQIPSLDIIRQTPRDESLLLIFHKSIQSKREAVGQKLKKELEGFLVAIHTTEPTITIEKLITDIDIEVHQLFFENCAKDYRNLGKELIFKLADQFKITINEKFPLLSFGPFKSNQYQSGTMGEWNYFLHGYHCGFQHNITRQIIEVPLVFSLEFGDLDPYFFTRFIKSSPPYQPLPVPVFNEYEDGVRINNKMLSLGKFEPINSNIENHSGIAVTDRDKVKIDIYLEVSEVPETKKFKLKTTKQKFNLWKFLGLK